eukprot:CAMPEP_0113492310 /NCGR_PEP_ID=MMETSP0014_2-20120614/28007_1 /TAXON_ID=2857 /ORGANISM="Nitzschia sp." /LENGTH=888 /DNA_ID=CAMNT_0000386131 /DNA_START=154 /DNA_END=2816 /DNA_ORIENTATION=+ /assembly_acc=CAM_ASM_000159
MLSATSAGTEAFSLLSPSPSPSLLSIQRRRGRRRRAYSTPPFPTPRTALASPANMMMPKLPLSSTSLHVVITPVTTTTTITTLITGVALSLSALSGMTCQKRWPAIPGILGSLITAGCLSTLLSLPFVPSSLSIPTVHPLYDLCFQLFLPASLTLLLLAYRQPSSVSSSWSSSPSSPQSPKKKKNLIATCIRRTALPFLVASIASWIGCWTSYKVSTRGNWFVGGLDGSIAGGGGSIGGGRLGFSWLLPWVRMMMMMMATTARSSRTVAGERQYLHHHYKTARRRIRKRRVEKFLKSVAVVFIIVIMISATSGTEAFSLLSPYSTPPFPTPRTALASPANMMMPEPPSSSTSLHAVVAPATTTTITTIITGVALSLSALSGMTCQKRWPAIPGILGSLITAGCLSTLLSLSFVPSSLSIPTVHPLYDLCFQLFLPASLTLLLLAYRQPSSVLSSSSSTSTKKKKNFIATCIRRTALPFLVASIASWIGCWTAYKVSTGGNWFVGGLDVSIGGGSGSIGRGRLGFSWLLPTNAVVVGGGRGAISSIINEEYARNAASVLTASYVGGSVNAMATSRILSTPADLLGSLVAADLITMSFYFSFLEASLDWSRDHLLSPRRWLEGRKQTTVATKNRGVRPRPSTTDTKADKGESDQVTTAEDEDQLSDITESTNSTDVSMSSSSTNGRENNNHSRMATARDRIAVSIPLLTGTYVLVSAANRVERIVANRIGIPGISCAVLAIIAPIINSCMQKYFDYKKRHGQGETQGFSFETITDVANPLSDFFFLTFFASLGLSVDLSTALMSFGPSCLAFSTLALTIHVVGTILGCWPIARLSAFWNRRRSNKYNNSDDDVDEVRGGVGLEEAWIASNAAIGGPATAAAYVMNCMKGR